MQPNTMSAKDSVINWIAPHGAKNALAGLLAVVGVAAVFGVSTVGDSLDSSVQTWAFATGGFSSLSVWRGARTCNTVWRSGRNGSTIGRRICRS